jgi:hypothetical protein
MHYITVYNEQEKHIGWIDSGGNLTSIKEERAGFSSQQTADDFRMQLEIDHKDWYTELENV